MVIVVATVTAAPGCEDALGALLEGLVDKTRAEAGCLQYDLHRNDADPAEYVFYERWESQAHLDAHLATPHFLDTRTRTADLRAVDPVIATYTLVR